MEWPEKNRRAPFHPRPLAAAAGLVDLEQQDAAQAAEDLIPDMMVVQQPFGDGGQGALAAHPFRTYRVVRTAWRSPALPSRPLK